LVIKCRQHLVDGVFVEQPFVDGLSLDGARDVAFFVPLDGIPLILFLLGEVVVRYSFPLKFERHGNSLRRHKKFIAHGVV
jgi:hypothetical protein